jgi:hypothetical protein
MGGTGAAAPRGARHKTTAFGQKGFATRLRRCRAERTGPLSAPVPPPRERRSASLLVSASELAQGNIRMVEQSGSGGEASFVRRTAITE